MVGGAVNSSVGGCVDAPAVLSLMQMNIDLGVLGACAVSSSTGVGAYDLSDAAFKRAVVAASGKSLVLVTNEKFAARAPHRVAELKGIDAFVVEHDAPRDALEEGSPRRLLADDRRADRVEVQASESSIEPEKLVERR